MSAVLLSESVTSMPTVKTLAALTFARVKMDSLEMERHAQLLQVGSTVSSSRPGPSQVVYYFIDSSLC